MNRQQNKSLYQTHEKTTATRPEQLSGFLKERWGMKEKIKVGKNAKRGQVIMKRVEGTIQRDLRTPEN